MYFCSVLGTGEGFFFCFLYNKPHPCYIQLATPYSRSASPLPIVYTISVKKPNLIHPIAYFLCPILFLHHQKGYQMQDPFEARFLTFPNSLRSLFYPVKQRTVLVRPRCELVFVCRSLRTTTKIPIRYIKWVMRKRCPSTFNVTPALSIKFQNGYSPPSEIHPLLDTRRQFCSLPF